MISAQDPAALAARDAMLREAIERHGGITVVGDQAGSALPGGVEHFGYADGFAQPSIEGSGVDPLPGQGAPLKDGGWRPIRAGEFILGYHDEENAIPAAPAPDQLTANGSYLVYRKLRQDVAAFRRTLADAAATTPAARSCWRPSSSGAGATARRSTSPPTAPTPPSSPTPRATTRSPSSTTRTGCAAPPAATSAAPTRATACRSRASSSTATA